MNELNHSTANEKEILLLVAFYSFVALSSIINLGVLAAPIFVVLLVTCALVSPRSSFLVLTAMFYLPMSGVGIPLVFILATIIVGLVNFIKTKGFIGYEINRRIIALYVVFLILRFISILFVENYEFFFSYFFISFSVFIHIIVISTLVKEKDDIPFILRMWGFLGAAASVLGYLHFSLQDIVYIRQISENTDIIDKGMIEGSMELVRWLWVGAEPNFHGLILLIPFAINFSFLIKKSSILNVSLTLLNFFGIIGTFSRSSLIVSIVVVLLFAILPQSRKNSLSVQRLLVVFVVFAIAGIVSTTYIPDFLDRFYTIQEAATTGKASGRLPLYKEAFDNFLSNPIFGVGTGQTVTVSRYHLESHNLFLQTLGENGLLNFYVLLLLFGGYLRKAYNVRFVDRGFFIACVAIILNSNTVSFFDLRLFFSLYVLLNFYYFWRNKNLVKI